MAFAAWHIPVRLITGAYILNTGLRKRAADTETAQGLHGFAKTAYPQFEDMPPEDFTKLLSTGEIVVGALLLTPIVPTVVAGAALTTFAGLLGGLYLRTPGMREDGSLQPTEQGIPLAKDSWLLAIGTALLLDGILNRKSKSESGSDEG
jgi:hypothetical protein